MSKRPRSSDEVSVNTSLLSWLESSGAQGIDGLHIAADGDGGIGAFARHAIQQGQLIAAIPQRCVLSVHAAEESALGRAVRAAAKRLDSAHAALLTDEVLLWIYMAVGRMDPAHPWHAYLASLPSQSPDPACWPAALRDELNGTPVGASVRAAVDAVHAVHSGLVRGLSPELRGLVPEGSLNSESLLWARGAAATACPTRRPVHGLIRPRTAHASPRRYAAQPLLPCAPPRLIR